MALDGAILANGTLGNSAAATLYTVTGGDNAYITSIKLVNTSGSSRTVNIFFKSSGGTAYRWIRKDFSLAATGSAGDTLEVLDDPNRIRLPAAAEICGDASNAGDVVYTIMGLEVA